MRRTHDCGPVTGILIAFLMAMLAWGVFGLATPVWAQGTLFPVDIEPVPGPADSMVVVERGAGAFVVTLSNTTNRAYSHKVGPGGELTPVGSTPTGTGPKAIALARHGQYAIVVNSGSNDLSVMTMGEDGLLQQVGAPVPSGGVAPSDVAVAFNDLAVVVNRGNTTTPGGVTLFGVGRNGSLTQIGSQQPAGLQPHQVAVSERGLVAVGNSASNDLSMFDLDRHGSLIPLPPPGPIGGSPKALSFHGAATLFVATHPTGSSVPPPQDRIEEFRVGPDGALTPVSGTEAGYFLNDIEANDDGVFAVTANGLFATSKGELRVYHRVPGGGLILDAQHDTAGPPPSFQQITTMRGRHGIDRHVFVTEFQEGTLRSLNYDHAATLAPSPATAAPDEFLRRLLKIDQAIAQVIRYTEEDADFDLVDFSIEIAKGWKHEAVDFFVPFTKYGVSYALVFTRLECLDLALTGAHNALRHGDDSETLSKIFLIARECKEGLEHDLENARQDTGQDIPLGLEQKLRSLNNQLAALIGKGAEATHDEIKKVENGKHTLVKNFFNDPIFGVPFFDIFTALIGVDVSLELGRSRLLAGKKDLALPQFRRAKALKEGIEQAFHEAAE